MKRHKLPTQGQQNPSSHCAQVKTLALFWLKAQFQYTQQRKQKKSQDLLLTDPRMGKGHGEMEEGQSSVPGHQQAGDKKQGSKHLL